MIVIENCNSLSDLRQKLMDGEEVRTARDVEILTREEVIGNLKHAIRWNDMPKKEVLEIVIKALEQEPCEDTIKSTEKERLIKSDISSIENRVRHAFNQGYDFGYKEGIEKSKKQSQTGHWIRELIRNEKGGCIGAKMICSECGNDNKHDEYMIYCPNCGEKMDEPQKRSGET